MRRISTSWRLIEEVLKEHAHSVYKSLRRPVSDLRLGRLNRALPSPVPRDLEQSLRVHDGMRNSYLGCNRLVNNWALLSTAEILSVWKMEWELQRECEFGGCQLTSTGQLKKDTRWREGWIPALDREGDKVVIDLDPGSDGKVGQVFRWYNAGGSPMRVITDSWAAWLDRFAEALRQRRFTLDEWGGIELNDQAFT